MSQDLRFPVGQFQRPDSQTAADRAGWIAQIAALPQRLRDAVAGLSDPQLDTPYRPDGWTVRQLVHHIADSHLQAYTRFKLALTEDQPTIRPYDEARWAELRDSRMPVGVSLALLEGLHARWVELLRGMGEADFARGYHHPDQGRVVPLGEALAMYTWHGTHHLAHVTRLAERQGWTG